MIADRLEWHQHRVGGGTGWPRRGSEEGPVITQTLSPYETGTSLAVAPNGKAHAALPAEPAQSPRWLGWVFFPFFSAYVLWALGVLSLGVVAAVAHHNPNLHNSLHDAAFNGTRWARLAQRTADASHRSENYPNLAIDYGFSLVNLGLAIFLVWLRPRDRTARLLAIGMVGTAAVFNLQAHTVYEVASATFAESITHDVFHLIAALAYVAALLLFPDGRLVPRWKAWKVAAFYAGVVAVLGPLLVPLAGRVGSDFRTVALIIFFGVVTPLSGVAAQGYRYRRSPTPVEQQQSRLLFWALAPALIVGAIALVFALRNSAGPGLEGRALVVIPTALFRVFQPVFSIIPIALLVGILRFRLWNIDKVISRTLVYSVLAGFVSAVYVGVVVGVGSLLGNQNTGNLWLSIVATGIIAIAFQPVKERVQKLADRLVYGHRATPYEVLSEFSEEVAETPATDELLARMARILAEGTTARQADIWVVVGNELRATAGWPDDSDAGDRAPLPLDRDRSDIPTIPGVTAAVPVRHHDELLGALAVTKPANEILTPTEDKLLGDLARQAGLVLRNVRLTAELLQRLEELSASRQRIVAAGDEERRRLERNLHDGAQQQLVALKVQLGLAEGMAAEFEGEDAESLTELLGRLRDQAGEALENLRDLARGIYPPLLAAEGLPTALTAQARKAAVPVDVAADGIGRYTQEVEAAVYFCCLEALQNISKYANASRVSLRLDAEPGALVFAVHDDGCGFDPDAVPYGSGCQNMADRLESLDGTLRLESAPGLGTKVVGRIPASPRV